MLRTFLGQKIWREFMLRAPFFLTKIGKSQQKINL